MRRMILPVLALAAVALPIAPRAEEPVAEAGLPADVEALIFRNASCNSMSTHADKFTPAQLEAARSYLKCDAIANDVALLRRQYQSNPPVLQALDIADLPADVDDLIHRRVGCDLPATMASEHPNRTKGFEAARLYLKCDSIAKDEAALRRKYNGDPRVLGALDGKWVTVTVVKRVPLKIAPESDPAGSSNEQPHAVDR